MSPRLITALCVAALSLGSATPEARASSDAHVVFAAEHASITGYDGGYGYVAWTLHRPRARWEVRWRNPDGRHGRVRFARDVRVRRVQIVRIIPPGTPSPVVRLLTRACRDGRCTDVAIDPRTGARTRAPWVSRVYRNPAEDGVYVTGVAETYSDRRRPGTAPHDCPALVVRRVDGAATWRLPVLSTGAPSDGCYGVNSASLRDGRLTVEYAFEVGASDARWAAPWVIGLGGALPTHWVAADSDVWSSPQGTVYSLGSVWADDALIQATVGVAGGDGAGIRTVYRSSVDALVAATGDGLTGPVSKVPRLSRRQRYACAVISDGARLYLVIDGMRCVAEPDLDNVPPSLGIRENRVIIERVPPPKWQATPRS